MAIRRRRAGRRLGLCELEAAQGVGTVWVAGADGCGYGWFRASRETETGEFRFDLVERASDLLARAPRPWILAIDIPIGLPEAGPRECDTLARQRLGRPRMSSVFPAPIRPALHAGTREEASRITAIRDGRKVGCQAWALYSKIREVDHLLQYNRALRRRIREVHPEVCFWAWSNGRSVAASKKTPQGRSQRLGLAEGWLGDGFLREARGGHSKKHVADDDILDAVAALWTATRIAKGTAETLPDAPPADSTGLPMEMVY